MKPVYFLIFLLVASFGFGQNTISGNFSPAEDYNWLIVYKVSASGLNYVVDGKVDKGIFSLQLPAGSEAGTYRLVYAIPLEDYHIDIIYNGNEDVSLNFDSSAGLSFTSSQENIILDNYYKDRYSIEEKIIAYYNSNNSSKEEFKALFKELKLAQQTYEINSKGLMANDFISSNAPYIPKSFEPVEVLIANRKASYFDALDLKNPVLQNSGFLQDKLRNFAFTALPLEATSGDALQLAINDNITLIAEQLREVSDQYKLSVYQALWSEASKEGFDIVSDFIYTTYIKALATQLGEITIIESIEAYNRLRPGAPAPNIEWSAEGELNSLSGLPPNKNFLLVFWSSTCSHCLSELPKLHTIMKAEEEITVIAIGLEEDTPGWENEIKTLPHFKHAISIGKWESEYAKLYGIQQTPSYFVLDRKKEIIAKPDTLEEVLEFFAHVNEP